MIDHYQDAEDANNSLLTLMSFIGFLGRKMMLSFGLAGHAMAGSLSREMEYDADRHAVHLAGTKNFIESMAAIERFAVAHSVTTENLRMLFVSAGVLVDNIPRFMMHIGRIMPGEVIRRIADEKQKEQEEKLDTHPPTRQRVEAARKINQTGILNLKGPASNLIRNWPSVCQQCTIEFYSEVLGTQVNKEHLTKLEDILADEHKLLLDKTY